MAKSLSKWLNEAQKQIEKEKKNPGKENREKIAKQNSLKRGSPIPSPKIVQTKTQKLKTNRSYRKRSNQREINKYIDR